MKLFDTHFVEFGQVLAVSGQKTLAISNRYLQVVKHNRTWTIFRTLTQKSKQT